MTGRAQSFSSCLTNKNKFTFSLVKQTAAIKAWNLKYSLLMLVSTWALTQHIHLQLEQSNKRGIKYSLSLPIVRRKPKGDNPLTPQILAQPPLVNRFVFPKMITVKGKSEGLREPTMCFSLHMHAATIPEQVFLYSLHVICASARGLISWEHLWST